jgi:dipeptidyl-peptidase 4
MMRSSRLALLGSLAALFVAGWLGAADVSPSRKALTLERITGEPPLMTSGVSGIAWRDGTRFSYLMREGTGVESEKSLWEYDASTQKRTKLLDSIPLPDSASFDAAVVPEPGQSAKKNGDRKGGKPATLPIAGAIWNPAGTALLLSGQDDLWLYDVATKSPRRLTHDAGEKRVPTFSPDGARVAFVRKNDLYVIQVATGKETRLSQTGTEHVFNGRLDWVYEEELANRRSGRSYEWAPDSSAIVYLRLDENRVPVSPILNFLPVHGTVEEQRYPKAGDPNAIPSVHLVDLATGQTTSISFDPDDLYVAPEFSWTADSASTCFLTLNRAQTELSVKLLARTGGTRTLLTEKDASWINSIEPPRFLKDGSGFLLLSERSGFLHLYRYGLDGRLKNAVTQGRWMIRRSPEIDEKAGLAFVLGTEKDPREQHVYRVRLDGTGFTRLTREPGTHGLKLSPDGSFFIDTFSDSANPPRTALVRANGSRVSMVDEPTKDLAEYRLGTTELSSFTGVDGTLFYTRLLKPADFDPRKKYPVVVSVYGGPHEQVVRNAWGVSTLFDELMASRGFLVWSMDNRGSWGRGHRFETPLAGQTGQVELADQLEGIAQLKKLPFVDPARIGIWGWSYGGYLTLYAATHAGDTFKCAVAGAPVTDWKYYDTIYSERYMKTPKENPAGYEASAPLTSAARLGTRLLILHGTADDNVHMQNSIAFMDALMRAGKDFTFVPLPGQKHGPRDPVARLYSNRRILEFFEKNL